MNKSCFVPECNATAGVLFPKNADIKLKWLKALGLENRTPPNPRSFICLDHFQPNGQPGVKSKSPENEKIDETSAFISDPSVSDSKLGATTQLNDSKKSKKLQTSIVQSNLEQMCRLCMIESFEVTENVSNKIDDKFTIADVIGICLYPLKVLPNDKLSKKICTNCLQFLKEYYDFHQMCVEMDAIQCSLNDKYSDDEDTTNISSSEEEYLHEERLSDYEQEDNNKEKQNSKKVLNGQSDANKEKYDKEKEDLLKVLEGKEDIELTIIDKPKTTEAQSIVTGSKLLNKRIDSLENQLNEMANETIEKPININNEEHFSDNDNEEVTENIIIQMVDEEEVNQPSTSKLYNNNSKKRKIQNQNDSNKSRYKKLVVKNETVTLPSCIKLEVANKPFKSPLGTFKSERIQYIFDSKYIIAGGYLYDLRLMKNNIRRLKCIVNKCQGVAHQRLIQFNKYDINVEVVKAHNHEIPNGIERKKQMFFHILSCKMQSDKNFNFHLFYERICQLDKNISLILPLRQVVDTICKQAPAPLPPLLRSFNDFYKFIENDEFYKIHFTSNHVQFYQAKCESDDGGKAVIFGNLDVVNSFSDVNLMYVDSSFVIDSQDFAYQLVTVLLWIDQTFYPIFYAIVNMRSLEIYNKVFTILHNDLAPKLRPAEIVTDYEANLYYALGYTYVESSIGGSIFYFSQNIYKKMCSLNMARELELNANLRTIYNMILMLPLLPEGDILDELKNIEVQAAELDLQQKTKELFRYIYDEWIVKVTPALFCVYRLESRIDENIVAPFKKLRDLIMLSKPKGAKTLPAPSIVIIIEKLLDLEKHVRETYLSLPKVNTFKDVSSTQKKMIIKGWNYWENDLNKNIYNFYMKILGYIKCMENQLWIWGFYRFDVTELDVLIDSNNFTPLNNEESNVQNEAIEEIYELQQQDDGIFAEPQQQNDEGQEIIEEYYIQEGGEIRRITNEESTSDFIEELISAEPLSEEKFELANNDSDQNMETIYNFVYK